MQVKAHSAPPPPAALPCLSLQADQPDVVGHDVCLPLGQAQITDAAASKGPATGSNR